MVGLPRLHVLHPRVTGRRCVAATVLVIAASLPVARIGELPSHLPNSGLAACRPRTRSATLFGAALAIAALASHRVAVVGAGGRHHVSHRTLRPQPRIGGPGAGVDRRGAVPAGCRPHGAIARTAVNVRAGARTRVSAIVHSLVTASAWSTSRPARCQRFRCAALAAVLMVTSFRMISATTIGRILRSTRSDAWIFVLTAVVTVCFDLIEAVEIGVLVAAVFALRSLARRAAASRARSCPVRADPATSASRSAATGRGDVLRCR